MKRMMIVLLVCLSLSMIPAVSQAADGEDCCIGLDGAAYGVCRAAVKLGCDVDEEHPACAKLAETYEKITGEPPPWVQTGEWLTFELNDRNALEKSASGTASIHRVADGGIIEIASFQASGLLPDHQYFVWKVVQYAGEFDPVLTVSPNFFRSTVTTDQSGQLFISLSTFPGPAAALEPETYRVDVFVTHAHETPVLDETEANLIRSAEMGEVRALEGYDLLLSSVPFDQGLEVTVPPPL